MWESGALGTDNPDHLLQTVFYTMGLHFSLCGGQEHRNLRVEELTQIPADKYDVKTHYQYIENGSKKLPGEIVGNRTDEQYCSCLCSAWVTKIPSSYFGLRFEQATQQRICFLHAANASTPNTPIETMVQNYPSRSQPTERYDGKDLGFSWADRCVHQP